MISMRVLLPCMLAVCGIDVTPSLFMLCAFFPVSALWFVLNPSEIARFDRHANLVTLTC